jgi:hypothetical protein
MAKFSRRVEGKAETDIPAVADIDVIFDIGEPAGDPHITRLRMESRRR